MTDASHFIGLMSGTSIDGVDAVIVRVSDNGDVTLAAHHELAPPGALRERLLALSRADARISIAEFGALNQAVGAWFAQAANEVIKASHIEREQIAAIGSHGQTIWHAPDDAESPYSLQIGSASLLAANTGLPVVADFRNSDMAVGGQGAPLVCAFHRGVFAAPDQNVAVVNIGGISNITFLPTQAAHDPFAVTGFDSGPGNGLMDAWIHYKRGETLDANGRWAASGQIQPALLSTLKADPYFTRRPPKSTGREYFGLDWLLARGADDYAAEDVQATLCELTAQTIADSIVTNGAESQRILLCGGGVHNQTLYQRLAHHLPGKQIARTNDDGVDADWVEAMAFAWLARQRVAGQTGNAPSVTGARQAVVLGGLFLPPG